MKAESKHHRTWGPCFPSLGNYARASVMFNVIKSTEVALCLHSQDHGGEQGLQRHSAHSWISSRTSSSSIILCSPLFVFPCGSAGKESTCNAGDLGSIPGLGRFPGDHFLEAAPVCASPGFPPSLTSVWPGSWASGAPLPLSTPRYPLPQGPPGPPSCEQPPSAALLGERSPNTSPSCSAHRAKFVFPSLTVGIFPAQVFPVLHCCKSEFLEGDLQTPHY